MLNNFLINIKNFLGKYYDLINSLGHVSWAVIFPASYAKRYYKLATHRKLNLKTPKDYNEKVQWLKVYSDTSLWTDLSDKYKVREYIDKCGLSEILVKLYGVFRKAEEIDFDQFPDQLVLKTNNGCGKNILVYDKSGVDFNQIRELLNRWVKERPGLISFQPHLWNIDKRIVAEELLSDNYNKAVSSSLIDYKFFCFHGEPEIINVIYDRKNKVLGTTSKEPNISKREQFFDLEWRLRPDLLRDPSINDLSQQIPKPTCFDEMLRICRILSRPFPQVRVDLYEANHKVYFGEMTFTPGGMDDFTDEFYLRMGDMMDLTKVQRRVKRFII